VSGFTQSMMWKQFNPDGTLLYHNFLDTVTQIIPMYILRAIGGTLYLTGAILLVVNVWRTVKSGTLLREEEASAMPLAPKYQKEKGEYWHRWIERRPLTLLLWSIVVILIGGAVEIIPTLKIDSNVPKLEAVKPYTPLELAGRDLYIREGCNACHSQMIRPFRSETKRYGEYSKAGEFVYDHPFLWGSKRTGPDLHRLGGKYGDLWHYNHMMDPTRTSPGSIMPRYPWLLTNELDFEILPKKLSAMQTLGVPYTDDEVNTAKELALAQATRISDGLNLEENVETLPSDEIIALIAYLQRLGTDINPNK